jgi:hypothetical protein
VFVTQPAERALYLNGAGTGVDAGAAAFTANGVVYASSTSALATGSALTFDGTTLGVRATSFTPSSSASSVFIEDKTTWSQGLQFYLNNAGTFFSSRPSGALGAANSGGLTLSAGALVSDNPDNANGYTATSSAASVYRPNNGLHIWYANTGLTAGNIFSATEQMRLTSTGLGIGTASPVSKLDVVEIATIKRITSGNNMDLNFYNGSGAGTAGNVARIRCDGDGISNDYGALSFWTGRIFSSVIAERMRLDSAGNLGLGTAPTGQSKFQVYTGNNAINGIQTQFNGLNPPIALASTTLNGVPYVGFNTVQAVSSDNQTYAVDGFASRLSAHSGGDGGFQFNVAASGTAGNAISFTQAMTLDASGNLVLGQTSATYGKFAVSNGTNQFTIGFAGNTPIMTAVNAAGNGYADYIADASSLQFRTTSTERARISSDGTFRVKGAGTAGSTDAFQVAGTAPADAARIDSSGNLLVGTTNNYGVGAEKNVFVKNSYVFASDNTGSADNRNWSAGVNGYQNGSWQLTSSGANNTWPNDAYRFAVTRDGSCYNTTGTYGTLSDARFKDNVATARPYLEDLIKLRVVKYSLKSEQSNVATKLGLIAQEVEEVFPNMVDVGITVQGEEFKSVKMSVLVPMLLSAIQEQQTLITALTARITALESSTLQ